MKNSDVLIVTQHVAHVANGGEITLPVLDSLESFASIGAKETGALHYRVIERLAQRFRDLLDAPAANTPLQPALPSNDDDSPNESEPPESVSSALDERLGDDDLPPALAAAGVGEDNWR